MDRKTWNVSTANEFRNLAVKEAMGDITKEEHARLEELQVIRRNAQPKHVRDSIAAQKKRRAKEQQEIQKFARWLRRNGCTVDFIPAGATVSP